MRVFALERKSPDEIKGVVERIGVFDCACDSQANRIDPLRMTGVSEEICCQKKLGDASASPVYCLLILLLVLLFLLCLFLGCHGFYSPFPFFMDLL